MTSTSMISFLGTGSGIPSADRFFSSSILRLEGAHLLIDAGEPCVHLLRDRGSLLLEIDAILITHGHVDHIGGVPALLQGCKLLGRVKPLTIYLPSEMIAPLRAWIAALYLIEGSFNFPLIWKSWHHSLPEVISPNLTVTPFSNAHLEQCYREKPGANPALRGESYSLVIEAGDFRAIFSGDLASADELKPLLSKPTTLLVSELAHFSSGDLAEVLHDAPLSTLCLIHLSEEYAADRSQLKMQLEEKLPQLEEVFLPEDGERLDF